MNKNTSYSVLQDIHYQVFTKLKLFYRFGYLVCSNGVSHLNALPKAKINVKSRQMLSRHNINYGYIVYR